MKQKKQLKRYFAGGLAVLTAVSMMPVNVYADESPSYYNVIHGKFGASSGVNYGDNSKIVFDTGEGPGLNKSTLSGWAAKTKTDGYYVFDGNAGHLLSAPGSSFSGGDFGSIPFSGGNKPDLPWQISNPPAWTGYTFAGWKRILIGGASGGSEEMKTALEPAFPYYNHVIYKAMWSGSTTYNLKTEALRDFGGGNEWKFHEQTTGLQPGNAVERVGVEVPGYKLESTNGVAISDSRTIDADTNPIPGSDKLRVKAAGNGFEGVMPNNQVTVKFKYEPDTSKTFRVKAEYVAVDGTTETPIVLAGNNPNIGSFSAESDNGGAGITIPLLTNIPTAVDAGGVTQSKYTYLGHEIVTGSTDSGQVTVGGNTYYKVKGLDTANSPFTSNNTAVNGTTPFVINKMPNQAVTVKYKYAVNTSFPTNVTVKYRSTVGTTDPNFPTTLTDVTLTHTAGSTYSDIVLPAVDHYTYSYIDYDTNQFNSFTPAPPSGTTAGSVTYDPKEGGDTITVYYSPNLSEMATVTLSSTQGGSLGGITTPPQFIAGNHALSDIVASVTTSGTADAGYVEDGWYYANAAGNGVSSANSTKIEPSDVLSLAGGQTTKLIFRYVKDPNAWSTVRFRAGNNGTIAGAPLQRELLNGTGLSSAAPTPSANAGYVFAGWYNSAGNLIGSTAGFGTGDTAQASDTYTAMFMLDPLLNEDYIYAIPHLNPSVDANGNGRIRVENVNTLRDYVVVDENGNVVGLKSGINLQNGAIENLVPGQKYNVYEVAAGQPQAIGSPFVVGANQSQPAVAIVPPVGNGYSTSTTGNTSSITINPASSSAVYALVDENGDVVAQTGSADGWVSPTSGSVTFNGLSNDKTYTVVSKPVAGNQTPDANAAAGYGRSISLSSGNVTTMDTLTVTIVNEGRISSHSSNGNSVAVSNQQFIDDVKVGDQVSISTNSTDAAGNAFVRWQLISGNVSGFNANNRSQTISVNSSTVLEAVYAQPTPATPSVAVRFAPETGAFGISTDSLKLAKNSFNTNATVSGSDFDALSAGKTVEYIVRLDKRSVSGNVAGLVEAQRGDDAQTLWQLNIGLKRNVNSINKPVPAENENYGPLEIYTSLSPSDTGMLDYALYRVDETSGSVAEVPTQPDLNGDDFKGIFSFNANIGESYVLSYSKPVNFKLVDTRTPSNNATIRIRKGSKLVDNGRFMALGLDFTSNLDNGKYVFRGYSRSESSYQAFDINSEVLNSDLTLYAFYELAPDWTQARGDLGNAINTANTLLNNAGMSEELRNKLNTALSDAVAVFNKTNPSPTVAEMNGARDALNAVIEEINGYVPPVNPNNNNGNNNNGGNRPNNGGGGGRGTGGGGGGGGARRGQAAGNTRIVLTPARAETYMDNVDGSWNQVGDNWEFNLKSGDKIRNAWVDIVYTSNGQSRTETYLFDAQGIMQSGWANTETGWYYLSTTHDGTFGRLTKGWLSEGGNWYYLDQISGVMRTGWINIGEKYYYLSTDSSQGRPAGAMFASTKTPDGYDVDANGEWIREMP